MTTIEAARFWSRVDFAETCWRWSGAILKNRGYGVVRVGGKNELAHRVAWATLHGGELPSKSVLHRCDNRRCVRPDHLFLGSQADNIHDMLAKGRHYNQRKTHCPKGHAYLPNNLYVTNRGGRQCKLCVLSRKKKVS